MNPVIFFYLSMPISIGCAIYLRYMKKKKEYEIDMRWGIITAITFIVLSILMQVIGIYDSGLYVSMKFTFRHSKGIIGPDTIAIAMMSSCIAIHIEHALINKQKRDKAKQYTKTEKRKKKK